MRTEVHYEKDFYAWTEHQALLLRQGKYEQADMENIIEEIEAMGRSEKRELVSRLAVLAAHLLKWEHQPAKRSRSWTSTIKNQRLEVEQLLEDNPGFRNDINEYLGKAYRKAVAIAENETGLDGFPEKIPFTFQELMESKLETQ